MLLHLLGVLERHLYTMLDLQVQDGTLKLFTRGFLVNLPLRQFDTNQALLLTIIGDVVDLDPWRVVGAMLTLDTVRDLLCHLDKVEIL